MSSEKAISKPFLGKSSKFWLFLVIFIAWTALSTVAGSQYQVVKQKRQAETSKAFVPSNTKITISSGEIIKTDEKTFELKDLQGKVKTFVISDSTVFISQGKNTTKSILKIGQTARVIPDQSDAKQARQVLIIVK